MNLDEMYIAVFIRQDMFMDHQMVHNFHLGFLIGRAVDGYCQKRNTVTGHPIQLLFSCANEADLKDKANTLRAQEIEYISWSDPDSEPTHDDYGLIGIVSQPLTKRQRNKLPRFDAWHESRNSRKKAE